ncbi:MAG: ABC transporter ATP-binding protein [Sodalis sp. (in: enterobacteria)]|uniref:ABC transporter ATP-binding protein n=1 Tax=Sodalis sp. (in: enterobacteria) TaxID=1898979 RepID=UPI003F3B8892
MGYLTVKQLNKHYGPTQVFANIDFSADEGEFVTLLGPSGCGKSTLLRCLAGLTAVDSGEITLDAQDLLPPQQRGIGMLFQSYALFPNMTVTANVTFGLKMQKLTPDVIRQRTDEALALVELQTFAHRYPYQLSGGQSQRVALARSLVTWPQRLLLDEPLSALDARIRRYLRDQIRLIQQELKLTAIFITHDQEKTLTLSDRVVLINQGHIVQNDSAEMLYTRPGNAFVAGFIGSYNILEPEQASALTGRGHTTRVAIRPESITLAQAGQGLDAVILAHRLLGNVIRYRVKCRQVLLLVDVLNRSAADCYPNNGRIGLQLKLSTLCEVA